MLPNISYEFVCEKDATNHFFILIDKKNVEKIFVSINSSLQAFEVFVCREENFNSKPDFIYNKNRFFIKYPNFVEIKKLYLKVKPTKEKIKYEILIKLVEGILKII